MEVSDPLSKRPHRGGLPPIPSRPQGPDRVSPNDTCEFRTSCCAAPDSVEVCFDWGDRRVSDWTLLPGPDTVLVLEHAWRKPGHYSVAARSRFPGGNSSDWSVPFIVVVADPGSR
jgi:hypothetical protein